MFWWVAGEWVSNQSHHSHTPSRPQPQIEPTNQQTNQPQTADRISVENGAVICNCKRWPLIIDPQGQGIKWLRQKEAQHGLQVIGLLVFWWGCVWVGT